MASARQSASAPCSRTIQRSAPLLPVATAPISPLQSGHWRASATRASSSAPWDWRSGSAAEDASRARVSASQPPSLAAAASQGRARTHPARAWSPSLHSSAASSQHSAHAALTRAGPEPDPELRAPPRKRRAAAKKRR